MNQLDSIRESMPNDHCADERALLERLIGRTQITSLQRQAIVERAVELVEAVRVDPEPHLIDKFLTEYGLSSDEGVALMCLAEALLRVPDAETVDKLIEDKIAPSRWSEHLGQSSSPLINASTWALMITGRVLDEDNSGGISHILHDAVKRLGEPVIRAAIRQAMGELGRHFILGETISEAVQHGRPFVERGYTYSYDVLGEAAMTATDADEYFNTYRAVIDFLAPHCQSASVKDNPGISVKLSALHPRYEVSKRGRVLTELAPRVLGLARAAKEVQMGFNIDAEEASRHDLFLDVIEQTLKDNRLRGWDGFGVVVQAYSKRAAIIIDWLYELANQLDCKIMVRLVKGAYWDKEIKQAQIDGVESFPVFTWKSATDVSYLCCAKKILGMTDRLYPQFATHNAHTVAAVQEMAEDKAVFEFQRLHGMGEALHGIVKEQEKTRCRIYAPIGQHGDLLAYLVRRLLENGANSSFINQVVDLKIPPQEVAKDPFVSLEQKTGRCNKVIDLPVELFGPNRKNSKGWDLASLAGVAEVEKARVPFRHSQWTVTPMLGVPFEGKKSFPTFNPSDERDQVGSVCEATPIDVENALEVADSWTAYSPRERARILNRASDLYQESLGEMVAILTREAGKTLPDAIAELRESVDFLRYYASQCALFENKEPHGLFTCISPWNFPLAIFTGQIAAALAAGNAALAKSAEATPIIASRAVSLLHKAGVPRNVLQFLPGRGSVIGHVLTSDPRIGGVCFTGSMATAQTIHKTMASNLDPSAPLIAETGGINAMIVDSTALPEQAVKDVVDSTFQSAGQRCSALRILYLQDDIATGFMQMLFGYMDELQLGNPWQMETDIGPVISQEAKNEITAYIKRAREENRLLKQIRMPTGKRFVPPTVIKVESIKDLKQEVFGPVLHIALFQGPELPQLIGDINNKGFGLTFGLHTRIDDRVDELTNTLKAGNIYINRNQIGAIVGSQPFGGEGLSGTGPKAGGPHYLPRFLRQEQCNISFASRKQGDIISFKTAQIALDHVGRLATLPLESQSFPGPAGESNRLSLYPRGVILCLGPSLEAAEQQKEIAQSKGCRTLIVALGAKGDNAVAGHLDRSFLTRLRGLDGVALWGDKQDQHVAKQALAVRPGAIIPLFTEKDFAERCVIERHVCINTAAMGGNVKLLSTANA